MPDQIQSPTSPQIITGMPDAATLREQLAASQAEKEASLAAHRDRLAQEPQLQTLADQSEPYVYGEAIAFVKDGQGNLVSPLDLEALGLPAVFDERTPAALLFDVDKDSGVVKTASLIVVGEHNSSSLLSLEQADQKDLMWQYAGNEHSGNTYRQLATKVDNPEVVTVAIDTDRLFYDRQTSTGDRQVIMRAPVTPEEARLQNPKVLEAQHKKNRRLGRFLAGLAMTTAVTGMAFPPQDKPAASRTFETYLANVKPDAAEQATINARRLFEAGDIDALNALVAESDFSKTLIEQESFAKVEAAQNFDELTAAMSESLAKLDIGYTVLRDNKPGEYDGYKDDNFGDAKTSALGILDGVNEIGPLASAGKRFDIQAVSAVYSRGETWGGLYVREQGPRPILRLPPAPNRSSATMSFEHEEGHHEDLTKHSVRNAAISYLRGTDFVYGPKGTGNGKVGVDIPTEYAGTDQGEQIAEMIDGLFGQNTKLKPGDKTILQEEDEALLASMEADYPGISAMAYKNALTNKPDLAVSVPEKIGNVIDDARRESALLVVGILLFEAVVKVRYNKSKIQLDDQRAAGVR